MDPFKACFTDDTAATMLIGHTGFAKVHARCTYRVQPLYVCINKPFKFILSECWEDHVVKIVRYSGTEPNNNPIFKLSSSTRQDSFFL